MEESLNIFLPGETDANAYSPLVLAWIGDGVYEMLIRTRLIVDGNVQVYKLHKRAAAMVKASAQAELVKVLFDRLTEEEQRIYRRGRNAKSNTTAKHATMTDYRMATGFEALAGYLYLTGRLERLMQLVQEGLEETGKRSDQE